MLTPLKQHFQYLGAVLREVLKKFPQHDFGDSTMEVFTDLDIPGKHFGYLVGRDIVVTWSIHVGHATLVAMVPHPPRPLEPLSHLEEDIGEGVL
jgi:hypothetical protein